MISIFKNVYIDKFVNEYSNTYQRTIKKKPIDANLSTYIHFEAEINDKDPKFKIDRIKISKYKNVFAKVYTPKWSEEAFVIKKSKSTVPRTYIMKDLYEKEIVTSFHEKVIELKK